MINPQIAFLRYLRIERSLLACDEVTNYGCRADVMAIDKNKKHVLEYEFKNNSRDLKYAEKKKSKYQQQYKYFHGVRVKTEYQHPHRFYFVVSKELWDKEKDYLEKQNCGVIIYFKKFSKFSTCDDLDFLTVKPCKLRKKNTQKYHVAVKNVLARCTSAYVNLLTKG